MQVHRFQHIVEIANEGVIIFDEHYNISYANKNMAKPRIQWTSCSE